MHVPKTSCTTAFPPTTQQQLICENCRQTARVGCLLLFNDFKLFEGPFDTHLLLAEVDAWSL